MLEDATAWKVKEGLWRNVTARGSEVKEGEVFESQRK